MIYVCAPVIYVWAHSIDVDALVIYFGANAEVDHPRLNVDQAGVNVDQAGVNVDQAGVNVDQAGLSLTRACGAAGPAAAA